MVVDAATELLKETLPGFVDEYAWAVPASNRGVSR